ncbi:MAG: MBL fold metallo-hydrolase, partial [Pseudomonadota bacterium]
MTETFVDTARVDACGGHIYSVDTHYVRPGLDASHIMIVGDEAAFVDTGVNSSVPGLLAVLAQLKVAREAVRYVFLTHIHLDHAGGAGRLMQALPNAELVVHPRGAWHMASPAKLVAGATAVYGEARFQALYGEIEPVPKSRLKIPKDGEVISLGGQSLEIIYTEGHARHHYCLWHPSAGGIFTGDSFGISYRVFDSDNGALVFPTTTPVHFDPEAAHASVDRIVATGARFAILTHYSRVDDLPTLATQL